MAVDSAGICEEFRRLVSRGEIDLARAAMVISRLEYPELDLLRWVQYLDELAGEVRRRLPSTARASERIAMINQFLFVELQYRGNEENYYDPRNSCLNAVIERKCGIPITLSVLYMEIANRVGLATDGVSFPGHFLVRVRCEQGIVILDPFHAGKTLSESELRRRLAEVRGQADADVTDLGELLAPASRKDILVRMLRNLKRIYVEQDATDKALVVMTLILMLDPNLATELRDRGLLYRKIEAFRAALADLAAYLKLKPDAEDGELVRTLVVELRTINSRFN